jgi:hypothetical protein
MTQQSGFSTLLARYGTRREDWPRRYRLVLPLLLSIPANRDSWSALAAEEKALENLFQCESGGLEMSSALMQRLAVISERPQQNVLREPANDELALRRLLPIGVSTAMASLVLGVAVGFSDVSAPLFGDDAQYVDLGSVEASAWLQSEEL